MVSEYSPGISVVICCYNSAKRLPETLKHLAAQEGLEDIGWEVIVVDNNSTDNTAALAESCWINYGAPSKLRVVKALKQGLNEARIKGYEQSQFEFLCFCDDDNWLMPKYLNTAFTFLSENEDFGLMGGLGIPVFEHAEPAWFCNYQSWFAVGPQWYNSGDITETRGWVNGAGMCLRREALNLPSLNFISTDRKGEDLSSWGDKEIGLRVALSGWRIWYESELTFRHFFPAERFKISYVEKLLITIHSSDFILDGLSAHVGMRKEWFKCKWKRKVLYLFLRNLIDFKQWTKYKEFGYATSFKAHVIKLWKILCYGNKYNLSFKNVF